MTAFPTHEHAVINFNHLRDEHLRHAEQRRQIHIAIDVSEPATPRWFEHAKASRRIVTYAVKVGLGGARAAFRVPGEPTRGPPGAGGAAHDGVTARERHLLHLPIKDPACSTTLRPAGANRQDERTREKTGGAPNLATTFGYAIWTSSLPLVS